MIRVLMWGMTSNYGGIEAIVMNIYRNIDRTKVQFDFLLNHNQETIAYEDEILSMGGKVYRVLYSQRENPIKAKTELLKFLKNHKEINAIHINANFPYGYLLKIAKQAGVKVRVLHSHNSGGGKDEYSKFSRIIHTYRDNKSYKEINKYATHYFACSDLAGNYMFPNKEYIWIKNGINIQDFIYNRDIRNKVRKELKIREDTTIVGFVGRFREQKNPLFTIDVFNEYHKINTNSKLLFVGTGELKNEMDKKIEGYNISKDIIYVGSQENVSQFYQAMDMFLLPSRFEGLGIVYVEAQACGMLTFATDVVVPKVACITEKLMTFINKEKSAKQWAEIMLSNNFPERKNMYNIVKEKGYDIVDVAKQVENFYLEKCK